jgi:hypothetical protein
MMRDWGRAPTEEEAILIKSAGRNGKSSVRFTLDPQVGATRASVCGEWNDWSTDADVMSRDSDGGFSREIELEPGRAYRFRYLIDGVRWENDWDADAYVSNDFGGDDSLVDLTALAGQAALAASRSSGAAKKRTPAKKAPAAKKAAAKGPAKKAPRKTDP